MVQWHGFQREAKQIIAAIGARQATLASFDIGGSVEAVESQQRKFATFTKALTQLEERVETLHSLALALIKAKHMESPNIEVWNQKVTAPLLFVLPNALGSHHAGHPGQAPG